jgi:hypothetical protein
MSIRDKVAEAMRLSLPLLPGEAQQVVMQMLQPASLAIMAATVAVWAGSQFFGVGEVVDAILLVVGVVTLGFSVFSGGQALYEFAVTAAGANSRQDLQKAAEYFAKAVTILGISTVQAVLLRGQAAKVIARGKPQIQPRIAVGDPPVPGNQLRVTRTATLPGGVLGVTDEYGTIEISRGQSLSEQRLTLLHELVHRYFSPRTGPFRKIRAELNISAYTRSAIMKYLEEAMAEGYSQLRVNGFAAAVRAYRFPLDNGYVTVSQIAGEGQAIGTIMLGGALFHVSISLGPMPAGP